MQSTLILLALVIALYSEMNGTDMDVSFIIKMSDISGSKRPRTTFEEQNPSVHVMYNCLTRLVKMCE